jgi:hypothetical protein
MRVEESMRVDGAYRVRPRTREGPVAATAGSPSGMRSRTMLALLSLATLVLAGCSSGGTTSTSANDATQAARQVAAQTAQVRRQIERIAGDVRADPGSVGDDERARLEDLRGRADDLAQRAGDEVSGPAGDQLAAANRRLSDAAGALRTSLDGQDQQALRRAGNALKAADTRARAAADRLSGRLGDDARDALDSLREQVSGG